MAEISTKEVFDAYFEEKGGENAFKLRGQADRNEVYEYEKKLGKSIFDMNVDELCEMIGGFDKKSIWTVQKYVILFRSIFEFYSEKYRKIDNPFDNKKVKGRNIIGVFSETDETYTKKGLDSLIRRIHEECDSARAEYSECILLLFFNGFAKASEIANLNESDIDFETKTVRLPFRAVQLSDRCMELLVSVHERESIPRHVGEFVGVCQKGKYFKYFTYKSKIPEILKDSVEKRAAAIKKYISVDINQKFNVKVSEKILYFLGVYCRMVNKYGKEKANEMITAKRVKKNTLELENIIREEGLAMSVSIFKTTLYPYAVM